MQILMLSYQMLMLYGQNPFAVIRASPSISKKLDAGDIDIVASRNGNGLEVCMGFVWVLSTKASKKLFRSMYHEAIGSMTSDEPYWDDQDALNYHIEMVGKVEWSKPVEQGVVMSEDRVGSLAGALLPVDSFTKRCPSLKEDRGPEYFERIVVFHCVRFKVLDRRRLWREVLGERSSHQTIAPPKTGGRLATLETRRLGDDWHSPLVTGDTAGMWRRAEDARIAFMRDLDMWRLGDDWNSPGEAQGFSNWIDVVTLPARSRMTL